ncbi:MAG: hypothetical protein ACOC22_04150 [bacterium]
MKNNIDVQDKDEIKQYLMQENEKLNVDELDITLGQNADVVDEELEDGINADSVEGQELSEEEQRQLYIEQLKKMKMRFNPIKHVGNKTINPYGTEYKQKRKQKNKQAKAARKTNRQKK